MAAMLLSSDTHGPSVELDVVGYQFPEIMSTQQPEDGRAAADWDANWLMIRGRVRAADGETWGFDQPCLTTWEAAQLADWLEERVEPHGGLPPGSELSHRLIFTEPNLGFAAVLGGGNHVLLEVTLAHESQNPSTPGGCQVVVEMTADAIQAAARQWRAANVSFPPR